MESILGLFMFIGSFSSVGHCSDESTRILREKVGDS